MGTRFAACKSKRKLICIVRAHSSILLFQSRWSWLAFTTIIRDFFTAVNLYLPVSTWRTRWNSFLKCCCVRISIYTHIYIYIFTLILCNEIILFSRYIFFPALLKEVREAPLEMVKSQKYDAERMALYPNLDYKQLYNALTQLIDVVSSIHIGLQGYKIYHFKWSRSRRSTNNSFLSSAFGQALLQCIACLLPFLDHDLIDNVAYLTASSISVLPLELHQDIVNYLCFYILPFTISKFFFFFFILNLMENFRIELTRRMFKRFFKLLFLLF